MICTEISADTAFCHLENMIIATENACGYGLSRGTFFSVSESRLRAISWGGNHDWRTYMNARLQTEFLDYRVKLGMILACAQTRKPHSRRKSSALACCSTTIYCIAEAGFQKCTGGSKQEVGRAREPPSPIFWSGNESWQPPKCFNTNKSIPLAGSDPRAMWLCGYVAIYHQQLANAPHGMALAVHPVTVLMHFRRAQCASAAPSYQCWSQKGTLGFRAHQDENEGHNGRRPSECLVLPCYH